MKEIGAPQIFIDFGFYYVIGAALQRRVWAPPEHRPIYFNQYLILCADAGVGKGLVINPVNHFISHPKRSRAFSSEQPDENSIQNYGTAKKNKIQDPLGEITKASDTTTWQGLLDDMVDAWDGIPYVNAKGETKTYTHSSIVFVLEELESLLKKNTEDVSGFLIKVYDSQDYTYKTRSKGKDIIKKPCLSLVAGTTPAFMQSAFNDKLLNDGFASRTWFIYAEKNRFNRMSIPELTVEQRISEQELHLHIRKLLKLYGPISYTQEAQDFMDRWWPTFCEKKNQRVNNSPKLNSYYSRLNIHVQKLAGAMFFGEYDFTSPMIIGLEWIKKAINKLEEAEKQMHLALSVKVTNPLAVAGRVLIALIKNQGEVTMKEIKIELHDYLGMSEIEDLVANYMSIEKIDRRVDENGKTFFFIKKANMKEP